MLRSGLLEIGGLHGAELLWRKGTAWSRAVSQAVKTSISLRPRVPALLEKEIVTVTSQVWSREQRLPDSFH